MTSTREVLLCTDTFWAQHHETVRGIAPGIEAELLSGARLSRESLERITIAFCSPDVYPSRMRSFLGGCLLAPRLTWLQTFFSGTDSAVFDDLQRRGTTITNAAGANAAPIAQTVLAYLFAFAGGLPAKWEDQRERRWDPHLTRELPGLRLGIVGLGAIGSLVARQASALGMDVIGLRRSPSGDEPCTTWSSTRLTELLGWADALVIAAPLTAQTVGMIGRRELESMRSGAWLINVGRGEIVDEAALGDALASGRVGAAALDVFVTEPLPTESPLWQLPNVIITPHSAGLSDRTPRRAIAVFEDNLRRYVDGTAFRNVVTTD